jgi:GNAT superfamily N-acetyltransferase
VPFTVRRYGASDDDARLRDLHERALCEVDAYVEAPVWDADLDAIEETYLDAGGEFLVGELDDEIVAMGALKPRDERTAELTRMRVAPDHQQRGYGTRLLAELEACARELGYVRLVLDTTERQVGARRLYEKSGYERVTETEWRGYTVLFYEKSLD